MGAKEQKQTENPGRSKNGRSKEKSNVTMKTLKAWIDQTERILDDEELIKDSVEKLELAEWKDKIKMRFINNKF